MRILVTGAGGQLGPWILKALERSRDDIVAWSGRATVDLTDADATAAAFSDVKPDAVIHAAAMSRPAAVAADPEAGRRANVHATENLAELCRADGAKLVFVSTDMVFDGSRAWNKASDPAEPALEYGRTKLAGEAAVLAADRNAVLRVSLLYGPSKAGAPNFFDQQVAALKRGESVTLFHDEWRTPLDFHTAGRALGALVTSGETGLFQLGGPERMSRVDFARRLCGHLRISERGISPVSRLSIGGAEPRPADTSLDSTGWTQTFHQIYPPALEQALRSMGVR